LLQAKNRRKEYNSAFRKIFYVIFIDLLHEAKIMIANLLKEGFK